MISAAPPAYVMADKLAMIGISVRPDHVPALLSWSGVIGAALIGGWFALARLRAERRSVTMADLFARLDKQDEQIRELRKEVGEVTAENRDLKDKVRDRDELLEDYAQYVIHNDQHAANGYAPPPPTKTWRMRDHLEQSRAAKAND